MAGQDQTVPSAALWLGGAGALPFVAFVGTALLAPGGLADSAQHALAIYGAIILSFLGGIQWGLAISGPIGDADGGAASNRLYRRLTISVVPALLGWTGLLLPRDVGIVVLATAFALVLIFDLHAARSGDAPPWYPRLRWPLTLIAIGTLVLGALA